MKVFDEDGMCLGEFVAERIEDSKEKISDSFSSSWLLGILCFLWRPIPTTIVVILYVVLKSIWSLCKLIARTVWWFIRLPFSLLFIKECPEF